MSGGRLGGIVEDLESIAQTPRRWPTVARRLRAAIRSVARKGEPDELNAVVGVLERAAGRFGVAAARVYGGASGTDPHLVTAADEHLRRSALALTLCAQAAAASRDRELHDTAVVAPQEHAAGLIGAAGASIWSEWLTGPLGAPAVSNTLIVASCHPVKSLAGRMTVWRIDPPELVMHPALALRPLGAKLVASIQAAWNVAVRRYGTAGPGAVWDLEFEDADGFQGDGDSLGLAAAVAMCATMEGLRCDGDVLVTGALCQSCSGRGGDCCPPGGVALKEVGGLQEKAAEARSALGARRLVTPGYSDAAEPVIVGGLRASYCESLDAAVDELSGIRRDLRDFFGVVRAAPDESPAPFLGGRRLSDVFIWQDLLLEESQAEDGQADDLEPPAAAGGISNANRDVGESRSVEPKAPRRRSWQEVEARLIAQGAARTLVIQGAAGSGKSSHMAMLAARIATRAEADLQEAPHVDEVEFVVPVSLESLTRGDPILPLQTESLLAGLVSGDDPLLGLRRRLVHHLVGRGATARAAAYLAARVHEHRCWLLLDALDQSDIGQLDRLLSAHGPDDGSPLACRIVVTSRPGTRIPTALSAAPRARLADLTAGQVQRYVRRRFHEKDRQEHVMAMLEAPAVADLCRNPFLLTLTSWVADGDELPGDVTRNVLLEWVLRKLLGWDSSTSSEDADRADAWLRTLPRIVFELLRPDPTRQSVHRQALAEAIAANGRYPRAQARLPSRARRIDEADALVSELVRRGVLVDDEPTDEGRRMLRWPHRLFAEFLAAEGMAQMLCGENAPSSRDEGGPGDAFAAARAARR